MSVNLNPNFNYDDFKNTVCDIYNDKWRNEINKMNGKELKKLAKKYNVNVYPLGNKYNDLKDRLVTKYVIFELYNMYDMVEDEFGRSLEEEKDDENKEEKDNDDY